jgi:hypothetical protein
MKMTMRCPHCGGQAAKDRHEDRYRCACGWASSLPEDKKCYVESKLGFKT